MNIETAHHAFSGCAPIVPKIGFDLAFARRRAERIALELGTFCEPGGVLITGSTRRGRPVCNDIDIAVLPKLGQFPALRRRIAKNCTIEADGDQTLIARMADGVQLDLWLAHGRERDLLDMVPSNFGMICLSSTGSKEHNIWLATVAADMGLHFHPKKGIMEGNRIVASETEEQIFAALKLGFIPPEKRER